MPVFKLPPDNNVTLKPPAPSYHSFLLPYPHIYIALAILAGVIGFAFASRRSSGSLCLSADRSAHSRTGQRGSSKVSPSYWDSSDRNRIGETTILRSSLPSEVFQKEAQTLWAAGLLDSHPASPARIGFHATLEMDGQPKDQSRSRGVSTSATDLRQQFPSSSARGPRLGRRGSGSPRSLPAPSSSRTKSISPDGVLEGSPGAMADDSQPGLQQPDSFSDDEAFEPHAGGDNTGPAAGGSSLEPDYETPRPFSRPPPPPPLTPPSLSSAIFPFEDRRQGYAISIPAQLDAGFIHQPNPDYTGSSTSTSATVAAELSSSPARVVMTPRRRSYTKTVPVGIPIPTSVGSASSPRSQHSSSSSDAYFFSPSSYPPTSPQLPPPPGSYLDGNEYEHDGYGARPREIDLQGEIISVVDDAGQGWKRHTRVYGGGVCLACLAAGGQGGSYGDKVPLEERR